MLGRESCFYFFENSKERCNDTFRLGGSYFAKALGNKLYERKLFVFFFLFASSCRTILDIQQAFNKYLFNMKNEKKSKLGEIIT